MIKSKDIIILDTAKITDAFVQLNVTKKKYLICVDDNGRLKGVCTDGDIRRYLIKGHGIDDPIVAAINIDPVTISTQASSEEARSLLSFRHRIIPVIDEHNVVVGYYSFKEKHEPFSIRNRSIMILGMGYVGVTLGTVLAEVGFRVRGFDIDPETIRKFQQDSPLFFESGLQRRLGVHANKAFTFTTDIEKAKSDTYIITVGTPLQTNKKTLKIDYISKASEMIGSVLEKGDLVILRSTVPVGCSRNTVLKTLEEKSGLKVGQDFWLSFAPERTAEGVALEELKKNPQIIGGYDGLSYDLTARLFNTITHSVIDVGSIEAAELVKLMDNTFRYHIFAYANYMAILAEKLGLDIHELIEAANVNYARNLIPKPSPGVGGPCLSKDPYILKEVLKKQGINTELISALQDINESGPDLIKDKLENLLQQVGKGLKTAEKISIIGLAFKGDPETSDIRESTSLWFIDKIQTKSNVYAYDPVVAREDIGKLGITPVSLEEAFHNADAVLFLNNHNSYTDIDLTALLNTMNKPAIIIDAWHIFEPLYFKRQEGILYGGLGND